MNRKHCGGIEEGIAISSIPLLRVRSPTVREGNLLNKFFADVGVVTNVALPDDGASDTSPIPTNELPPFLSSLAKSIRVCYALLHR